MKEYKEYTGDELKNICKERGLKVSGKKNDLVHRLLSDDESKAKNPDIFSGNANPESQAKQLKSTDTISKSTSSVANYFLHLNSTNLSNYMGFGHFYPLAIEESEIYKNENRAKDILSAFEDYIIVAKNPINKYDSSDVLVELVLNGIKVNEFENSGLFYISEPIPVSRVKSIYFKTSDAKASFLSSVKTFPDSFVPSSICHVDSGDNFKPKEIDLDQIKLPRNKSLTEWRDKLDLFDKVLGLFAFIKNAGILYAERENKFENFTVGFFSTLNLINPVKQLSAYKENVYLRPLLNYRSFEINNVQREIFKSIIERVYANKSFDIKTAVTILESAISREHPKNGELTDIKEQLNLFRQLESLAISYKGVLQKEVISKPQNLPVLVLLFLSKFPNKSRQHTDKQAVRNAFIESEFNLPLNSAEYVLGVLGLNYGYKNMIKEDTNLKFSDSNFERLAASTQSIKFKLESYFDRFIVESAFRFAVQQKVLNDSFDFLNWSEEMSDSKPIAISPNNQYEYLDKSTAVMGQKILSIVRQDKTEKVFERIANQYSDKVENTSYLAAFFSKHFNLDKRHIIEVLKMNKGRYPMNELENVIELDSKTKKKQE
jgi:hypothetical protein